MCTQQIQSSLIFRETLNHMMSFFKQTITTEITINATPEQVRRALLDFASWDEWNPMVNQVTLGDKTPEELEPGDEIGVNFVVLGDMAAEVEILSNTESEFSWVGKLLTGYVFQGRHFFKFTALEETGVTKTKFVHGEDFSGALVPIYFALSSVEKSRKNYINLNKRFKAHVEKLAL